MMIGIHFRPVFGRVFKAAPFGAVLLLTLAGCASSNEPVSVERDQQNISQDVAGLSDPPPAVANNMVPLLIRVADTVSPAQAQALFKKYNCNVVQQIPPKQGTLWVLDAPKTKSQQEWVTLMQSQPGVTSAEVDLTRLLKVPLEQ